MAAQRTFPDYNDMADNKAYLVGSLPLRLETKEHVAFQIAYMERLDLGLDWATGGFGGIGLTLATATMRGAGGALELESTPGQGTTVTLTFPASAAL